MQLPNHYTHLAPFRDFFRTGNPILMYHHVGPRRRGVRIKGLYVSPELFAQQMAELAADGFTTPAFGAATCDHADSFPSTSLGGSNAGQRIFITFDDGFRDVFEHALPVLQQHRFRAIQFLLPELLGKTNEWQLRQGDVIEPLMDPAQVRDWLIAGQEIGAHTLHHFRLTQIPPAQACEEITESKKKLEDLFGVAVEHFCYPYGDWNATVRDLVQEAGYRSACTTAFGINTPATPPFALKRITARYRSRRFGAWLRRWWFRRKCCDSHSFAHLRNAE